MIHIIIGNGVNTVSREEQKKQQEFEEEKQQKVQQQQQQQQQEEKQTPPQRKEEKQAQQGKEEEKQKQAGPSRCHLRSRSRSSCHLKSKSKGRGSGSSGSSRSSSKMKEIIILMEENLGARLDIIFQGANLKKEREDMTMEDVLGGLLNRWWKEGAFWRQEPGDEEATPEAATEGAAADAEADPEAAADWGEAPEEEEEKQCEQTVRLEPTPPEKPPPDYMRQQQQQQRQHQQEQLRGAGRGKALTIPAWARKGKGKTSAPLPWTAVEKDLRRKEQEKQNAVLDSLLGESQEGSSDGRSHSSRRESDLWWGDAEEVWEEPPWAAACRSLSEESPEEPPWVTRAKIRKKAKRKKKKKRGGGFNTYGSEGPFPQRAPIPRGGPKGSKKIEDLSREMFRMQVQAKGSNKMHKKLQEASNRGKERQIKDHRHT